MRKGGNNKAKVFLSFVGTLLFLQVLYFLNRDYLRPTFQLNEFVILFLGSLPNFLAAFAAGIVFIPVSLFYLNKKVGAYFVYTFTLLCLLMLIYEEMNPFVFGSKINDINDMIASVVGAVAAAIVFEQQKSKLRRVQVELS